MVKAFLFAASILLCLELAGSIHCKACLYEFDGTCLAGKRKCKGEKRCVVVTVSQGEYQLFRTYGCIMPESYYCGMSRTRLNGQRTRVKCCWKGDYCNEKLLTRW